MKENNKISEIDMGNNIAMGLQENIVLSKWFHIADLVAT